MGLLTVSTVKNVEFHKSKMADGRHFKKSVKPPYVCDRSTDFDEIWRDDACWNLAADQPFKFWIFENFWKAAAAAILKNHKNRDISATVWPIFTKFGTLMQNGSLNRSDR